MKYFSPETSQKLHKMGLETATRSFDIRETPHKIMFNTLDICEIENAKKLWGDGYCGGAGNSDGKPRRIWQRELGRYINYTISDEERVKYVEDYLKSI